MILKRNNEYINFSRDAAPDKSPARRRHFQTAARGFAVAGGFSVFINRPSFKPLPVFILFAATFQNRIPAQILKTDIFMFLRINASDALNRYYGYSRLFRFFYDVFPVQNKRYSGFHCHSPYLVFF